MEQLASTLAYLAKMADFLEGLRQYEKETNRHDYVISGSYPVHELRKNLALAREFAERQMVTQQAAENGASANGHAAATTPNSLVKAQAIRESSALI